VGADHGDHLMRVTARAVTPRKGYELFAVLQLVGVPRRRLGVIAVIAAAGGATEALVLVAMVRLALAVSTHTDAVTLGLPGIGAGSFSVSALVRLTLGAVVVRLLLHTVAAWASGRMTADVFARLRSATAASYLEADWETQAAEPHGELQDVLTTHATRLAELVVYGLNATVAAFNFVALVAGALVVSPVGAGVTAAVLLGTLAALTPVSRMAGAFAAQRAAKNMAYASQIAETVELMREVKVYGVGERVRERLDRSAAEVSAPFFGAHFGSRLLAGLYQNVALAFVLIGMGILAARDAGSLATVGAVAVIFLRTLSYGQALQTAIHQMADAAPSIDTVLDRRRRYTPIRAATGSRRKSSFSMLTVDGVSYSHGDAPLLLDVSFSARHGELVGLVGRSGGGKSTLLEVLAGLRHASAGSVLLDGMPIESYSRDTLARCIGFVPQFPVLFAGSVTENIRFWRDTVTSDDVERAAVLVGLDVDARQWPQGLDTAVTHRGQSVSGGQRQRIGLARALAGSPSILLLDEPTSALDAATESRVREVIDAARASAAVVLGAHRQTTLDLCDRLVLLEDGRLQELKLDDIAGHVAYRDT
jgi:ABC-type multidrug transport system fused ATPase/permease subunit